MYGYWIYPQQENPLNFIQYISDDYKYSIYCVYLNNKKELPLYCKNSLIQFNAYDIIDIEFETNDDLVVGLYKVKNINYILLLSKEIDKIEGFYNLLNTFNIMC
mgnify:CR=1 FL=1|tara:strand:- start:1906 stop:2217 length:312 start_codon:yes stop_codon:yes gene_type:complete